MAHPKAAKPPAGSQRFSPDWKARAALLAIALLAYANSFSSSLVQDAQALLTLDDRIRAVTAANLHLIFEKTYWWPKLADGLYRPVTTLSFLFNYAVLGSEQNGAGYHVVNLLLHTGNIWLVYALSRRMLHDARVAFLAAALWAVHPIGTEAVTNIAGRADLLAAMAVLGALLIYTRLDNFKGWRTRAKLASLFVMATLGVFSKENAAVLIGLMVLLDVCRKPGLRLPTGPRAFGYAAVAGSLALLWAVRHAVLGSLPSPQVVYVDNPLRVGEFLVTRWTALKVVAMDLGLLVWPAGLSSDRSYHQIALAGPSDPWAWVDLVVVGALLTLAIALYRRNRILFFAAGFFSIALLPTSNLIIPIGSIMAERFLYLPSVAFAIAVVVSVERLFHPRTATILVAIAVVLCAARTFARNFDWQDNLALSSADVQISPRSFKLHEMLAKALYDRAPEHNLDRSIAEEERAWDILQPLSPALSTQLTPSYLGQYYRFKGDASGGPQNPEGRAWYEKSRTMLERARAISRAAEQEFDDAQRAAGKPLSARGASQDLYLNLAAADLGIGRYDDAFEACRYARGLDPRRAESYDGMALALLQSGHQSDAVVTLEEKALMEGFTPSTMALLAEIYQKLPGGACAVKAGRLDPDCPIVTAGLCRAAAELLVAHREARMAAPVSLNRQSCIGQ